MTNPWIVAGLTLFVWWFSTGALMWRVRRADLGGPGDHLMSVILGLPLLLGGFVVVHATAADAALGGVWQGFLGAVAIWGWIELAFLSGVITGPDLRPCPPGLTLAHRFRRALGALLWHELALLAGLALIALVTWGQANEFALWTYAVLFFARISAKLNLFLGVPRIHTEFLPLPLSHLASHFRFAPMNWVFPISITTLSFAAACWMERAAAAPTEAAFVGHVLLAVLTLLAMLEHWLMIIPLPDQKLWRWMLPVRPDPKPKTLLPKTLIQGND